MHTVVLTRAVGGTVTEPTGNCHSTQTPHDTLCVRTRHVNIDETDGIIIIAIIARPQKMTRVNDTVTKKIVERRFIHTLATMCGQSGRGPRAMLGGMPGTGPAGSGHKAQRVPGTRPSARV